MDRPAVQQIVATHLPRLSQRLGLHEWEITIGFRESTPGTPAVRGECTCLLDHQRAHIDLFPDQLADEAAILAALRHELFHIVLAPLDLYTSAVAALELPDQAHEILDRVRGHFEERAVAGMERMWRGLESHPSIPSEAPCQ